MAAVAQRAYIDAELRVAGTPGRLLSGLTFCVKDLFNVSGHPTSFGSPAWRDSHPVPTQHAAAVKMLLDGGASLRGKTVLDELAFSLVGSNPHYGTPYNPAAPARTCCGSSCGSASAVALGEVDIGLGSDTAGSVRVPASATGLFGFRPTWGAISLDGAAPLAPSFDTVGWFARSPELLHRVGQVLLPSVRGVPAAEAAVQDLPLPWPSGCVVPTDFLSVADPAAVEAFEGVLGTMLETGLLGPLERTTLAAPPADLGLELPKDWVDVMRTCQGYDVWQTHGAWVQSENPVLGPGVRERIAAAAQITLEQAQQATKKRERIREHLSAVLGEDRVIVPPSAPGPPPLLTASAAELDAWRARVLGLTCLASLAGLP